MEVFVQFLQDNIPLVVVTAIAAVGIVGLSAALITLKIRSILHKKKHPDDE